jgi:hypothetical protein
LREWAAIVRISVSAAVFHRRTELVHLLYLYLFSLFISLERENVEIKEDKANELCTSMELPCHKRLRQYKDLGKPHLALIIRL